jgi:hypothetical protein
MMPDVMVQWNNNYIKSKRGGIVEIILKKISEYFQFSELALFPRFLLLQLFCATISDSLNFSDLKPWHTTQKTHFQLINHGIA